MIDRAHTGTGLWDTTIWCDLEVTHHRRKTRAEAEQYRRSRLGDGHRLLTRRPDILLIDG
jgi:hypothetical protein